MTSISAHCASERKLGQAASASGDAAPAVLGSSKTREPALHRRAWPWRLWRLCSAPLYEYIESRGSTSSAVKLGFRFLPYLRPLRSRVGLALALFIAAPPVSGAILWLVAELIDDVIVDKRFDFLPLIGAGLTAAAVLKLCLDLCSARLEAFIVESFVKSLRSDLYRHVLSLSPGSRGNISNGDVLARLENDVERTEVLVFGAPSLIVADLISCIFFSGVLMCISWRLTLAAFSVLPVLGVLVKYYAPRIRRAARLARSQAASWLALAEERLGAGPLIHAFGTSGMEAERFARACAATKNAELRTVAVESWLHMIIDAAIMIGGSLIAAAGAYEIASGRLTLGQLAVFLGALGTLQGPVRSLAKATSRVQRGVAGARRVADLLDLRSAVVERKHARELTVQQGTIEFREIGFGYEREQPILQDFSLRIEAGEMVAIVGPSGSGKSSLVNLLLRLHDPDAGTVLIDDTDIRDVTLASLGRAVGMVFQEPHVFRGSIRENIRYGSEHADRKDVERAGRIALVEPFAQLSAEGWATQVGPNGSWLSGGQRQRIAIARALIRNSPILVFDEATASIDSETEELIYEALDSLAGRRTVLLVGHRLSSLRRADRIVVMERGRIVECGPPRSLLRPGSRYCDLFAAQLQPTELSP